MQQMQATPAESERKKLATLVGAGTTAEVITGLAAGTLAVLGLAGVLPFYMLAIATITAGAALLIDGLSVGAAYAERRRAHDMHEAPHALVDIRTGLSAQVLGGGIAVVLGVVWLAGSFTATWAAIAVIVLGCALLLGALTHAELDWSAFGRRASASEHPATTSPRSPTPRIVAFIGAGAAILGLLALVEIAGPANRSPYTLIFVALLAVGIAEVVDASAVLGRIAGRMKPASTSSKSIFPID